MIAKPLTATGKLNFLLGNPGLHLSTQKHENVCKISHACLSLTLNSENPTLSSVTEYNQTYLQLSHRNYNTQGMQRTGAV